MALKKPGEYFKRTSKFDETVAEANKNPDLITFTESFEAFKSNLSKIDTLNQFSSTLESYGENVEKVNFLATQIEEVKQEVSNLLKREDLDKSMLSLLLVVEDSIREIQDKVKRINTNNKIINEIRKSNDEYRLKLEKLEEENCYLSNRIKNLEEVFEKFNNGL